MKQLILGLFLIASLTVFSQNGEKNFIDQNYIEVIGKAEMDIVPDLIYLKIILGDKDNKDKLSLDEIEKLMINDLTELGIDINKDLSVKDFASNFKSFWIGKADIVLTKEYQLIVHDTKTMQKVYFEFQKLGISNVSIEKLDNSKIVQFRKDVKMDAIKAAKEKAEFLTSSINQSIGRAIFIQELDNQYLSNVMSNTVSGVNVRIRGSSSLDQNESSMPDIEFEKITIEYSILVRFELK
jgi:uncharacterized protein YggE